MDSEDNVHRLEGTQNETGGLIVKKKPPTFKVPQPSKLGLDKLAAAKRKEKEDAARKMSFTIDENDTVDDGSPMLKEKHSKDNRKFRSPQEETPTYTGGISKEARERLMERITANHSKHKEKGVYASTKDREKPSSSSKDNYYDKHRSRHYKDRDRDRKRHRDRHNDSSRREKTPRFSDEPKTPNIKLKGDPSQSSWDEDDDPVTSKKSAWDYPTPNLYKSSPGEWSERSSKSKLEDDCSHREERSSRRSKDRRGRKYDDDTPRPTPAHKYNAWMKDRKSTGATPGANREENLKWDATVDREMWEEEQKRLDREWYNMGEGYDEDTNPFSTVSDDYTKKKEEQLEQRKRKRMSAQQRQINKDNELWERNRMLTSGVVHSVDFSEDYDDESIDRVHLLVHNIVPPFLDGRIVFTKQPEPVIPVR